MPRPPRADEAGGLYHALNRGNLRATIFHKDADFEAFEQILHEGLQIHQIELFSYQLMPNHYHLVLRPLVDGEMSRFMGWVGGTHTMRYHSHYHTSGMGHVYQQRYKNFPIQDDEHFFVVCRYVERNALRAGLVKRAEQWRWGSLWRWLRKPETHPPLRYHRGPCHDFPDGSSESILRSRKRSWRRSDFRPSAASGSVMKAGWSPWHVASIWNRPCVRAVASGCASPKPTTKRPSIYD